MTGGGGVDSIPDPVTRRRLRLDEFSEQFVERNTCGARFSAQLPDNVGELGDHLFPFVVIDKHAGASFLGEERGAKNKLDRRVLILDSLKQGPVPFFPAVEIERNPVRGFGLEICPHIVHTDKHGHNVRLKIKHILLPSALQIDELVAAETTVEELMASLWALALDVGSDEHHVAVAVDVIEISMAPLGRSRFVAVDTTPVAVSNGIADEHDLFAFGYR